MDECWKICLLLSLLSPVKLCGPGRSTSFDMNGRLKRGHHWPPYVNNEASINNHAEDCSSLVQIISTDIIFNNPTYNSESRMTTKICRKALLKLSSITKRYWGGELKLYVENGYIRKESRAGTGDKYKLHMQGRAFDLKVVPSKNPRKGRVGDHIISKLGEFAFKETDFNFVRFDLGGQLHVSCPCSVERTESRCFPSDAQVNLQNGSRALIKDLRPGDSVLTMEQNGKLNLDEVVMLMHHKEQALVENYIRIGTNNRKSITLSRYHLIFVSSTNTKFAKDIMIGDQLFTYDSLTRKTVKSIVTYIEYDVQKKGMHAPLTKSGTLIVNDVYASCYAMFPSHDISHTVFLVWRYVYDILKYFDFSVGMPSNDIHWYPDVFRKTLFFFNVF